MKRIVIKSSLIDEHQKFCDEKIGSELTRLIALIRTYKISGNLEEITEKFITQEEKNKKNFIISVFDEHKVGKTKKQIEEKFKKNTYRDKLKIIKRVCSFSKHEDIKDVLEDDELKIWWFKSKNSWYQKFEFEKVDCDELNRFLIEIYPKLNTNNLNTLLEIQDEIKESTFVHTYKLINKIISFAYDSFSSNYKHPVWSAKIFSEKLNIITCPYCNMNFIHTYYKTSELDGFANGTVRPEIDHFYPKKEYPILAMSIFNLIPSCHQCNSSIKGDLVIPHNEFIHPYFDDMNNIIKFYRRVEIHPEENVETDYYKALLGLNNSIRIEVSLKSNDKKKKNQALNSLKFFHIIELYEQKKHVIQRAVRREVIYNDTYKKSMKKLVPEVNFKNMMENDSYDISNEILGKLFNDIFY